MESKLVRLLGPLALMFLVFIIGGCSGGSDGAPGATGATGVTGGTGGTGSPGTDLTAKKNVAALTPDQWPATSFIGTVTGVDMSKGTPVVSFKVTDASGTPVVGLERKNFQTATVAQPTNTYLAFAIAKLVPGAATTNDPSKWVSYVVTTMPALCQTTTSGYVAGTGCPTTGYPTTPLGGTLPVTPKKPTTDDTGTLTGDGAGNYTYTFYRDITKAQDTLNSIKDLAKAANASNDIADLGDVTYAPSLTHRVVIQISGNAPGTGTNTADGVQVVPGVALKTATDVIYDFIPATGKPVTATDAQREVVNIAACNECHVEITHVSHGGRNDTRYCVVCHSDQRKYGSAESAFTSTTIAKGDKLQGKSMKDMPAFIHKIHMGDELVKQGYSDSVAFNTYAFPQDPRNCTKCHDGSDSKSDGSVNKKKTLQGDNWKNVPNVTACGACHDGINFAAGTGVTLANRDADVAASKAVGTTATGHVGGIQTSNKTCVLCHDATNIPVYHRTTVASLNNPTVQSGVASLQYKISGVTINNKVVSADFQILKNGSPVALNTYAPGASLITGLTGECTATVGAITNVCYPAAGPGFIVAYATGQDGIAAPSDWNSGHDTMSLYDAWAGRYGNSLTVKDASTNTYTAVIKVSSNSSRDGVTATAGHTLALPADAKMVTALLAGNFVQPGVTERGGKIPGIPAMVAATGKTPDGQANVARRVIFAQEKCESCHDRLGTAPNFHDGNYSSAMCAACHTPNQGGSTGWSASFRVWVHGIHGADKRTVPFTWHAVSKTDNYYYLGYPGVLNTCTQCHLPGTYDFSASQYTKADVAGNTIVDSMLNVQAASGKLNPASATNYVFPQYAPVGSGNYAYGLMVDNTTDYGTGQGLDTTTGAIKAQTTQGNNLVSSPITAACSACHDSAQALSHYDANNGSFYKPRATAIKVKESCLVCHGPGKVADINVVHM